MIRLTLSRRFVSEQDATGTMHGYSLWTIGARVLPAGTGFVIAVDTLRPRGVLHYLETHMPGAVWTSEELAEESAPL